MQISVLLDLSLISVIQDKKMPIIDIPPMYEPLALLEPVDVPLVFFTSPLPSLPLSLPTLLEPLRGVT